MGKIEKGSTKFLFAQMISTAIVAMIIWPLFDLFYCGVIEHSEFHYSVFDHIVEPIIFAIVISLVFWALDRRSAKKAK